MQSKFQFDFVPWDDREIPRNLIFSILTSWLKSPHHSVFRFAFLFTISSLIFQGTGCKSRRTFDFFKWLQEMKRDFWFLESRKVFGFLKSLWTFEKFYLRVQYRHNPLHFLQSSAENSQKSARYTIIYTKWLYSWLLRFFQHILLIILNWRQENLTCEKF